MRKLFALTLIIASTTSSAALADDPVMDSRLDGIFRLGAGGKYEAKPGFNVAAKATLGFTGRFEGPINRWFTLGAGFSVYSVKSEFNERDPALDLAFTMKPRYAFMIRRLRSFPAEVYLLAQVGPTVAFDQEQMLGRTAGFGYNVGAAPGFQILFGSTFGLLFEVGYIRAQTKFEFADLIVQQVALRIGGVFSL